MSNQQTKITQRTITSIKATGSVYFIRDLQLTGFAIKVTATGKASYIAETRIRGGAGIRIDMGSVDTERLDEAKVECRRIIALAKRGIDPRHTREARNPINKSLEHHIKQYFEHKQLRETTIRTYRNQLNNAFRPWFKLPVSAITPDMVSRRRVEMSRTTVSDNYIRACFRTLKAILETADLPQNPVKKANKQWGYSVQSTPATGDQYLLGDGIAKLVNAYLASSNTQDEYYKDKKTGDEVFRGPKLIPNIHAAALFLLLIGGRKQDAVTLTWNQVDFASGRISFPVQSRKEKRSHVVPITGMIKDILSHLPRYQQHSELVFGMTESMFNSRYKASIKPLIKFSSKCLRKTFAEHCGLENFDAVAIGKGLNHSHATSGNVTTASYFTGGLVNLLNLQQMYLDLQTRYMHYLVGGGTEAVKPDFAQATLSVENTRLIAAFPSLFKSIATDELDAFSTQFKTLLLEAKLQLREA